MRGCWTTVRHSAGRERRRLLEDLLGDGDLADVVEERRELDPVDLGLRQLELAGHVDDDRGDERRRLAAVVGQRGDERGRAPRSRPRAPAGRSPSRAPGRRSRSARAGRGRRRRARRRCRSGSGRATWPSTSPRRRRGRACRSRSCLPGPAGDADRDRDRQVRRCRRPRSAGAATSVAQLLGQDGALLDVGLGQDEHELLAAVAADHVARPQVGADRLGDAAQDDVAGRVAVGVVDGLEVVDVDEGDRQRPLVARRRARPRRTARRAARCRLATPVRRSIVAWSWVSASAAAIAVDRPAPSRPSRPPPRGRHGDACSRRRRSARRP